MNVHSRMSSAGWPVSQEMRGGVRSPQMTPFGRQARAKNVSNIESSSVSASIDAPVPRLTPTCMSPAPVDRATE